MPDYTFACKQCQHSVDMQLPMKGVPEAVSIPCKDSPGKRCSLHRSYSAAFGLGPVAGAGMTPSRQSTGRHKPSSSAG